VRQRRFQLLDKLAAELAGFVSGALRLEAQKAPLRKWLSGKDAGMDLLRDLVAEVDREGDAVP
jgi:hypothetical protein